jgi:hypothetical protein
LPGSPATSVSQPFASLPSQFFAPGLQLPTTHAPFAHAALPFGTLGQASQAIAVQPNAGSALSTQSPLQSFSVGWQLAPPPLPLAPVLAAVVPLLPAPVLAAIVLLLLAPVLPVVVPLPPAPLLVAVVLAPVGPFPPVLAPAVADPALSGVEGADEQPAQLANTDRHNETRASARGVGEVTRRVRKGASSKLD